MDPSFTSNSSYTSIFNRAGRRRKTVMRGAIGQSDSDLSRDAADVAGALVAEVVGEAALSASSLASFNSRLIYGIFH